MHNVNYTLRISEKTGLESIKHTVLLKTQNATRFRFVVTFEDLTLDIIIQHVIHCNKLYDDQGILKLKNLCYT